MNIKNRLASVKSLSVSGRWIRSTLLMSALFCGVLANTHMEQKQLLQQANADLDDIRQARVDLITGFLYLSLAHENELPFRRDQGLALIRQSLSYLEPMMQDARSAETPFREHTRKFFDELSYWNNNAHSDEQSATRMRVAFHHLEHDIKTLDLQNLSALQILSARLHRDFQWILGMVLLSLAVIAVISIRLEKIAESNAVKLLEQEILLRSTQAVAQLGGWQFDVATRKTAGTEEAQRIFRTGPGDDLDILATHRDFYTPEAHALVNDHFNQAVTQGLAFDLELQLTSTPAPRWVRVIGHPIREGRQVVRVLGSIADITGQKSAETQIKRLSRLYQALSETNQAIIRMDDESELFPLVCRCAVDFGGFKMAWIGQLDTSSSRVLPVTAYGDGLDYLDGLVISTDAGLPEGQGPIGTALRENRPVIINDYRNDPMTRPWHERAGTFAWGATAAFPIQRGGKAFAVLKVFDAHRNAFDDEAITLLKEMAGDISFALDNFDRETQRRALLQNLDQAHAHMAHIIDVNPAIIYSLKPRQQPSGGFVIDFLSETARYRTGYSRDDWFTPGFWFNHVHPDDRPAVSLAQNHLLKQGTLKHQYRFLFADGSYRWIEDQLLLCRDTAGNPSEITGAWLDITELKQSEEQLQLQLKELQRWFAVTLDREERIGQLKAEVNALRIRLGEPPSYAAPGTLTGRENT